ncbi:MAG: hypothetical protein ACTHJX_13800 [Terriglobales bacterium]
MIQGYASLALEDWGGLVTAVAAEHLDPRLLTEARNVRFEEGAICTREGLVTAVNIPGGGAVRGLMDYTHLDGSEQPLVFDAAGKLYIEAPAGSGVLQQADPESTVTLPPSAWMNGAAAYDRAYLAFGDGKAGVATPASFDGTHLDPVTLAAPAGVSSAADAAAGGNIAAGVRYGMVLYQTRAGSLTAPQAPFQWTAAGGRQVTVSNLPIGPAQVAARVVAFTVAGGSNAGPYFYIGEPQTVNGISETSTVVAGNSATSATFNFDDDFLASSNDVTSQFRALVLPSQTGVLFSKTTQRMLWWGDPEQPSAVQCSEPFDAGFYLADTGSFVVADNNGQRVTAVLEYRNLLLAAKQDSIYWVVPNNGDPATWTVELVVATVGFCGPRAWAEGTNEIVFVHRSGVYLFAGGVPLLLSSELNAPSPGTPGLWERIHWAAAEQIWVHLDVEQQTVRIGVPLDGASECTHILKLRYSRGWQSGVEAGRLVPGRQWSVDTIAAHQAVRVRRPLRQPSLPADQRLAEAQLLLALAGTPGTIAYLDPGANTDNGVPIVWSLQTGSVRSSELDGQARGARVMAGVVQLRASGQGTVSAATVLPNAPPLRFLQTALSPNPQGLVQGLALCQGEAIGLRLESAGPSQIRLEGIYARMRPAWALCPAQQ